MNKKDWKSLDYALYNRNCTPNLIFIKELLEKGVDPNKLFTALQNEHMNVETIDLLLSYGANLYIPDTEHSFLFQAFIHYNKDIIQFLIKKGCVLTIKDINVLIRSKLYANEKEKEIIKCIQKTIKEQSIKKIVPLYLKLYLTDLQLVEQFKNKIKQIQLPRQLSSAIQILEGPIYAEILVPNSNLNNELQRNAPILFLLGDYHIGDKKCKKECLVKDGCYSLYNRSTLLYYINQLPIQTDVFIEIWLDEEIRKNPYQNDKTNYAQNNSSLVHMLKDIKPCFSHTKMNCPFPNIRFHMTDTRIRLKDTKYKGDYLIKYLLDIPNNSINYFKKKLQKHFPTFEVDYLIQLIQNIIEGVFTLDDFFEEPFFQIHSRTYHEWIQLPQSIRNSIRIEAFTCYQNKKESKINLETESSLFFQELKKNQLHLGSLDVIKNKMNILPFSVILVDIYTISRLLKKSLQSELSIIYLGIYHIMNIKEIIKSYYVSIQKYNKHEKEYEKCIYS